MDINLQNNVNNTEDIQKIRRNKLKSIIDRSFFSVTALSEAIKINRANISALLSGARVFTTSMSNRIESSLALPNGYLSEADDVEFSYKSYIDVMYYENINDVNDYLKSNRLKVPKKIFNLKATNDTAEMLMLGMPDDLMADTINKGDLLLIDCNQVTIEDGAIYLYEYLDAVKIRRFQIVGKDAYQLNYDNTKIKLNTQTFSSKDLKIIGKIICITKEL